MYTIIGGDQKEYGPITEEQLRQWIKEGRANEQTIAKSASSEEWKPLGTFPELSDLFQQHAPPPMGGSSAPPPVPGMGEIPKNNGFAVAGLVLSILGLACCSPLAIVGLILSIVGLVQVNNAPHLYSGKGLAIAGIVIACISIISFIVLLATGSLQEILRQWEHMR